MSNDKLNRFDEVEVPFGEAKLGDTVTITGKVGRVSSIGTVMVERGGQLPANCIYTTNTAGVTITRLVPKLPTEPGSVGTATARGVRGRVALRANSSNVLVWLMLYPPTFAPLNASEIKDYVPLLDGVE